MRAQGPVGRHLRALASYGLPGTGLGLPEAPLADDKWQEVLHGCAEQRLLGHLWSAVAAGDLPTTSLQRGQAKSLGLQALRLCLRLEQHLLTAVDVLDHAGLDHRVLKGTALAHTAYPSPSLRHFRDIDLLVTSEQFAAVVDVLLDIGYHRPWPEPRPGFDRRFGKGATLVAPQRHELDLHRTLVDGPFGLSIDLRTLWARPRNFLLAGRTLRALPVEAMVVHACYQVAIGDDPPRLAAMRDLAQLLLTVEHDGSAVHELVLGGKAEAVLARAVELTWQAFALEPDELSRWAQSYTPSARERCLLATYSAARRSFATQSLASLVTIPGVVAKVELARALALPSSEFLARREVSRLDWWRRGRRSALGSRRHR